MSPLAPRDDERRWLILGEDGRHVWLGRHSDPTPAEISDAEAALVRQGLAGWLAVSEDGYWERDGPLAIIEVRVLGHPHSAFARAVEEFERLRREKRDTIDT